MPETEAPPIAIGTKGPFGRVWNGEKYEAPARAPKTLARVGGRNTATKPQRSDLMAMGMNDKLPEGQERIIRASDLGDPRLQDESAAEAYEGVTVSTNEPPKYVQYDYAGIARRINRSTYLEVKRAEDKEGHRLHDSCPLCGGDHPETEWDPNACPAREPMSGFICPQPGCGKECWPDYTAVGAVQAAEPRNPAMKNLPVSTKALEMMAMANLKEHVGTYHPRMAMALGYPVNRGDGVYVGNGAPPPIVTPIPVPV